VINFFDLMMSSNDCTSHLKDASIWHQTIVKILLACQLKFFRVVLQHNN